MATKKSLKPTIPDFLMWVGTTHYPTVDAYINEAKSLGCCKRIGHLPKDLVIGKSRIFLAHDDGLVGDGFVFGYYVVNMVEVVVLEDDGIPEDLVDRNVSPIMAGGTEPERLCGTRNDEGAIYIVSYQTGADTIGLVEFEPVRKLERFIKDCPRFRGALRIKCGDKMIKTVNPSDFAEVPSRKPAVEPPETWTEEEDAKLIERMQNGPSVFRIAQEIAFETGRKKSAVAYHYSKLVKQSKEDDAEDSES